MHEKPIEVVAHSIREALDRVLEPRTGELVRLYLLEADRYGTGFAGLTFDELGRDECPPNVWGYADLLAVTTLDVRVKPTAMRTLLASAPNVHTDLLAAIPEGVRLWDADTAKVDAALQRAEEAWHALCSLPGIDWVTAGKLLARKRPELVPVYDSVVQRELGLAADSQFWRALRVVLLDKSIQQRIAALRPAGCPSTSLVRLLDIALWMRGSGSRAAREARRNAGIS